MEYDVFISYGSQNHDTAEDLCAYLEEHGLRCWIAPRNIESGSNYAGAITRALRMSNTLLVICSQESSKSGHVKNEVTLAFNQNKRILPYCLNDNPFDDDLEYFLSSKQQIRSCGDFEKDYERIRSVLGDSVIPKVPVKNVQKPAPVERRKKKSYWSVILPTSALCITIVILFIIRHNNEKEAISADCQPIVEEIAGIDTFTGTIKDGHPDGPGIYTFAHSRQIDAHDSEARIAAPGDYIEGFWRNGHLNQGEWFSAQGEIKAYFNLGDNPDWSSDWALGTCEQCVKP